LLPFVSKTTEKNHPLWLRFQQANLWVFFFKGAEYIAQSYTYDVPSV
jgi:hypothetical protein